MQFETTVSFILIQSTVLTEQHVSQVRAQTRKVAALGARDSPAQSPARFGEQSPSLGIASSRFAASPGALGPALASEAMGRTLSAGSHVLAGRGSAETMRRTASAGSRTGTRPRSAAGTSVGGSRRLSMEDGQARPAVSVRPTLETVASSIRIDSVSPSNAGVEQIRRLQSPLPIHAARRPGERGRGPVTAHEADSDEGDQGDRGEYDDGDPESLAASSTSSSNNSSSEESEPVMSRIFRRPPGYPQQQQQQAHPQRQLRQQRHPRQLQDQYNGSAQLGVTAEAAYGGVGLGISSEGSDDDDDGDESETQAAFLHREPAAPAAAGGSHGSHSRHQPSLHPNQRQPLRRPAALQEGQSSSPSSSASASPTTKVFKGPTLAASAGSKTGAGSSLAASAAAAARLQQSRLPGVKSPPRLHSSSRSAASARAGAAIMASREGSETGTTPSIGSSFSDLDDVSFTQSVLDEALGSRVEDTMVPHSSTDTLSSSANQRAS